MCVSRIVPLNFFLSFFSFFPSLWTVLLSFATWVLFFFICIYIRVCLRDDFLVLCVYPYVFYNIGITHA